MCSLLHYSHPLARACGTCRREREDIGRLVRRCKLSVKCLRARSGGAQSSKFDRCSPLRFLPSPSPFLANYFFAPVLQVSHALSPLAPVRPTTGACDVLLQPV